MDWLEQVVEHRTPTGRVNRIKVKSLPPKEREKYKPKKTKNEKVFDEIKKLQQVKLSPQEKNEKKQTIMDTFGDKFKDASEGTNKSRYHVLCNKVATSVKYLHEKIKETPEKKCQT